MSVRRALVQPAPGPTPILVIATLTGLLIGSVSCGKEAPTTPDSGPTKLSISVQQTSVMAGVAMAPAVQATVQDSQGNTVTSSTATIMLAISSGTGTAGAVLGGTRSRAAVRGIAAFNDLTIDKAGTGYTLTATAANLTSDTSVAFTVTPGAATALAFSVQPTSVAAGVVIAPGVQAKVQDAQGNTVTSSIATIMLAISSGTGTAGAVLGGTRSRAAVGGIATFNDLTID